MQLHSARRSDIDVLDELRSKLIATSSSIERNALAIKAAKTGNPKIPQVLIELIDRPELANERGTLVHCLGSFDCSKSFLWLVKLVCHGNWEVSHEAADILMKIDHVQGAEAQQGYDYLRNTVIASINDEWRSDLLAELLSMFD